LADRPELIIQAVRRKQKLVTAIKRLVDACALFTVDPEDSSKWEQRPGPAGN
jgi:hypothetical protein